MPSLRNFICFLSVLLATACTTAPHGAFADENGDPARGRTYAQDHCAACHAVNGGPSDQSPNLDAPTFREVANTPGFTRMALGAWLRSTHQQMPDFIVETGHIDDVYVYLETLRAPRSPAPQSAPH
ncbi:MAG: c-type cytochrome [Proteobacteria bacterium]|nr:c-type cytochrome [Pseudomonadota bacterium]